MGDKSGRSAMKKPVEGKQGDKICSAEVMLMLDAIRQATKEAVDEIEEKSQFRVRSILAIGGVALTILGYFAINGIQCVVQNKVNDEFGKYTRRKIDERVEEISEELYGKIAECTNALRDLKYQTSLLRLQSSAFGGNIASYDRIGQLAATDPIASACLASVDAYFASLMRRRGNQASGFEVDWGYQKVDMPFDEKIRRIKADPGLSKENKNLLISLLGGAADTRQFTGLLVRKACVCTNLFDRTSIIDCIHASFDTCPKSPSLEKLQNWWEATKRPEYDKDEIP